MLYQGNNHTFAICAYKESCFLEECILSVINQKIKSNVLIATSTPSAYIEEMAEKYKIPYFVREGKSNIADDWNFAYSKAETELITITHQDDIYCENYVKDMLECVNKAKHPLLIFGNYGEIRGKHVITKNRLLNVKKIMLFPLRFKVLWTSKFVRRRILSLGSPICCPSVAYVKNNLPTPVFKSGYRGALDWQAWEMASKLKGSFVYCNHVIMHHRIHQESETSQIIADSNRTKEDYDMFCKFWPKWIAKYLMRIYAKSQDSNSV